MKIVPLSRTVSVVLVGNFNPKIFTPHWFAHNDLIGIQQAEDADVEIIHSEVARFRLGLLSFSIDKGRFVVDSGDASDITLSDLVTKIFTECLLHTPIRAVGINLRVEFDTGSIEKRNEIGRELAPPHAWGEWGQNLNNDNKEAKSGMATLVMKELISVSQPEIFVQTKIEPSLRLNSVIQMEINNHFGVNDPKNVEGALEIMGVFTENYTDAITKSEWIVNQIMEKV